ncbi:MAG TPA: BatD family protein [Spirochaetota bacterium]|nr:BatD family protein [Spirochaetota bacterium]
MKSPGRMISALLALLCVIAPGYALEIETVMEPDRVAVGQDATLQIKIKGGGNADTGRVPNVPGLDISYRGVSRSFQWINGVSWSGMVLNYAVTPQRSGKFTVPPIQFTVDGARYQSRTVTLVAMPGVSRPRRGGDEREAQPQRVLKRTVLSKQRVYTGEPLLLRYYLLHSGINFDRPPVPQKLPETKWFVQNSIEEKSEDEIERIDGSEFVKTRLATFLLIPSMKGRHAIGGGEVVISYVSDEGFFQFPRQARVVLDEASVEVLPLPEAGKPAGYDGNVGRFTMDVAYDKKAVKVYDEVRVNAVIRGEGNFITLNPPVFDAPRGVKVIRGVNDAKTEVEGNAVKGTREFVFTLVPETAGDIDAGSLRFTFFDPVAASYRVLDSEKITLKVTGDASRGGIGLDGEGGERGPDVNLLWIALIVLAVAGIVAGVALWERRKYAAFIASKEKTAGKAEARRTDLLDGAALDAFQREVILSARGSDPGEFLKTAERVLGRLAAPGTAEALKMGDDHRKALVEMKERVYNIRYGGYTIGADEVKEMSARLRDVLKAIRPAK